MSEDQSPASVVTREWLAAGNDPAVLDAVVALQGLSETSSMREWSRAISAAMRWSLDPMLALAAVAQMAGLAPEDSLDAWRDFGAVDENFHIVPSRVWDLCANSGRLVCWLQKRRAMREQNATALRACQDRALAAQNRLAEARSAAVLAELDERTAARRGGR